jgi:hypothetical protein
MFIIFPLAAADASSVEDLEDWSNIGHKVEGQQTD